MNSSGLSCMGIELSNQDKTRMLGETETYKYLETNTNKQGETKEKIKVFISSHLLPLLIGRIFFLLQWNVVLNLSFDSISVSF